MPVLTEGQHMAEFLHSEAQGERSRAAITLLSGQNLKDGAVLGKVAQGGSATATADGDNTGNGAMGAITVGNGAMDGVYTLRITAAAANAGDFIVENPAGVLVDSGTVGVAFSAGGLGFTLADGATDFAVDDIFRIAVIASGFKWKEYDPANADGSEKVAGVLIGNVDASTADKAAAAVVRDAEVVKASLQWFAGATADEISTGLAEAETLGIIGR